MMVKEWVTQKIKDIFIGRKIKLIDNLMFSLSKKKATGWSIGNKIRNRFAGKREYLSTEKIIFIGGSPRSGTNLMASLLKTFNGIDGPYREVALFQDLKNKDILKEFELSKKEIANIQKISRIDSVRVSDSIIKKYKKNKKIDTIILNAPKQGVFIGELFKYFPNSVFVFMVRDGRDVAVSMKKRHGLERGFSIDHCAKTWAVSVNSRLKFRKNKNFIEIKYEDLTENPKRELSKIAKVLGKGLPSKKKILNYFNVLERDKLGSLPPLYVRQLSQPVYKTSIGRWKNEMSKKERKIFKKFAGDILIREGYVKDNSW